MQYVKKACFKMSAWSAASFIFLNVINFTCLYLDPVETQYDITQKLCHTELN